MKVDLRGARKAVTRVEKLVYKKVGTTAALMVD